MQISSHSGQIIGSNNNPNSSHTMPYSSTPSAQTPEGLNGLLKAVASSDRSAFAELYRDTSRKIFGILLRLLKRQELAEEILQETYVKIWQGAASFDPTKASAISWMATIARNRALDELRKHSITTEADDETLATLVDHGPGPGVQMEQSEAVQRLERCLQGMGDPHATLIRHAYLDGASREALAAQFEQPVGTVKTWLRRGLNQLKECLGEP